VWVAGCSLASLSRELVTVIHHFMVLLLLLWSDTASGSLRCNKVDSPQHSILLTTFLRSFRLQH